MDDPGLPTGLSLVRTTPEFTAATVPDGLLRAHRVAAGVWGVIRVRRGSLRYVIEESGRATDVTAGEAQVIEPDVLHHVEPGPDVAFVVEFHRGA